MRRLRIIHLITELNTGGAEQMLLKIVSRTDHTQFEPVVVSLTDAGPVGIKIAEQGIAVHDLGMKLGRPSLFGLIRFLRLLWKLKPDVLQSWLYHADLLGLICGKLAGIRHIVWGLRCSNMDLNDYRFL
ncbi:MAG: glycosyl transferase, partial [Desulfobacteraceae bacterium]